MKGWAVLLYMLVATPAVAQQADLKALRSEVQELRDREAIRTLLVDYGRTLDRRDYAGFGALFAKDGEYVSGDGTTMKGSEGAAAGMKRILEANAGGFREPNYHVFFNEVIDVSGDTARSTSMSFWVVPGEANRPQAVMMGSYEDDLVREDGAWKFKRRLVRGAFSAPPR